MRRLVPVRGTPSARQLHVGVGAAVILAIAATGCAPRQDTVRAPDVPTNLVQQQSDQAFSAGVQAYGQGRYQDALTSFQQARALSPTEDPRINEMIANSEAALILPTTPEVQPTATPLATGEAKPTVVTAVQPSPPATMSTAAPDLGLRQQYFGKVTLGAVPGRNKAPIPNTQFYTQDQIALSLTISSRPLMLRVFDADSGDLIAEVQSSNSNAASTIGTDATSTGNAIETPLADVTDAHDYRLTRFSDNYIWYHMGGEQPGHYRVELFANSTLTATFDYTVSLPPVQPDPTTQPSPEPTREPEVQPTPEPTPPPVVAPQRQKPAPPTPPPAAPTPPPAAPTPLPPPPTPTPAPTPATIPGTVIGGVPAGLDVDGNNGRSFIADGSGVIWTADAPAGQQQPTLGTPFNIAPALPLDLAVDQSNSRLYVAAHLVNQGAVFVLDSHTGQVLSKITLDGAESVPSDLRVDPDLGVAYVVMPQQRTVQVVDLRASRVLSDRTLSGLPQITSLAIDPVQHTVYVAQLSGVVTMLDSNTGKVIGQVTLSNYGLSSIAAAHGLAYAINTATHQLFVYRPDLNQASTFSLDEEPAAIAATENTGAVYVLSTRGSSILRVDPTDGSDLGRVILTNRSGHTSFVASDQRALRPRLAINPQTDAVYATMPDMGTLAAVDSSQFPAMAHDIPTLD